MTRRKSKKTLAKQTSLVVSKQIGGGVKKQSLKKARRGAKKIQKMKTPTINVIKQEENAEMPKQKTREIKVRKNPKFQFNDYFIEEISIAHNLNFVFVAQKNKNTVFQNQENRDFVKNNLNYEQVKKNDIQQNLLENYNFDNVFILSQFKILSGEIDCDRLLAQVETEGESIAFVNF